MSGRRGWNIGVSSYYQSPAHPPLHYYSATEQLPMELQNCLHLHINYKILFCWHLKYRLSCSSPPLQIVFNILQMGMLLCFVKPPRSRLLWRTGLFRRKYFPMWVGNHDGERRKNSSRVPFPQALNEGLTWTGEFVKKMKWQERIESFRRHLVFSEGFALLFLLFTAMDGAAPGAAAQDHR